MDPTANLAEQRRIIARRQAIEDQGGSVNVADLAADFARLAELAEALDQWLTGANFLPAPWSRAR